MADGFERYISKHDDQKEDEAPVLGEWLAQIEMERQVVIMKLRHYDAILVRHGRLKAFTLPQRVVR